MSFSTPISVFSNVFECFYLLTLYLNTIFSHQFNTNLTLNSVLSKHLEIKKYATTNSSIKFHLIKKY